MNNVYGVQFYDSYCMAVFVVSAPDRETALSVLQDSEEFISFVTNAWAENDLDINDVSQEPYGITSQPTGVLDQFQYVE